MNACTSAWGGLYCQRWAGIHLSDIEYLGPKVLSSSLREPAGLKPNVVYLKHFLFSLQVLLEMSDLRVLFTIKASSEKKW